jgi:molybdopterin/thiamine biosynthesis adenylyltransferase/proteasome lid subunit RPN8/RPN11
MLLVSAVSRRIGLFDPLAERSNEREQWSLFDSGYAIVDTVLETISSTIGSRPAETGGALLGSYGNSLIVDFLYDKEGEVTGASYVPSVDLTLLVQHNEIGRNLQFKGVVHSHPGSHDTPSGPDEESFLAGLNANLELGRYLAPIITFREGISAPNKLKIAEGVWASFFVAIRSRSQGVRVAPCLPKIVWFARDVRRLTADLQLPDPQFFPTDSNGLYSVSSQITLRADSTLVLAASGAYPETPPLVLYLDGRKGKTKQVHLRWNIASEPEGRLAEALADARLTGADGPKFVAFGRLETVLTKCAKLGSELDLEPVLVGDEFIDYVNKVGEGLFARSRGVLTSRMRHAHVLIAGCGSVGSYVAEHFVRSGAGEVTLLDPDKVDFANLSRANFRASDVGKQKIHALAERLIAISPELKINFIEKTLQDLGREEFDQIVARCDLVMSALDDRRAQLQINQFAYWHKKPAVFIGCFAKAHAGEVAVVDAPSPCFACATPFRDMIPLEEQGAHDYGTGRLVSEVALGTDIQSISAIGVRLGLSCLMKGTGTSLEQFAQKALAENQYAIFAVTPEFSLVDEVLKGVPAQYGHRSIWLTVNRIENCSTCGPNPAQPMVDKAPMIDDLKAAIARAEVVANAPPQNEW